jgi:hypothetical protein
MKIGISEWSQEQVKTQSAKVKAAPSALLSMGAFLAF